jgi:hypothetical protein
MVHLQNPVFGKIFKEVVNPLIRKSVNSLIR